MHLSAFSDYSLRVLMHLGANTDRLTTIGEIARLHAISENHLTKVVHQLGRAGYIETLRGKGGGMRLARAPREITLGEVLRHTETDFALVECFGQGSRCQIEPACQLKPILGEALAALFRVLDGYTLADLLYPTVAHAPLTALADAATRSAQEED
ncbi:MAG: Rrf2 family transcriptional regulator [Betaproteobacteria bacterium HGW-Betaproteobacteria-19]|nr:MAG: Rrf2 family transcriptional regulator [Betaproteobacteria bacterium HGW-Betaproteobacteria-19]